MSEDNGGWFGLDEAIQSWSEILGSPVGSGAYCLLEKGHRMAPGGKVVSCDQTVTAGSARDPYPGGVGEHLRRSVIAHLGEAEFDPREGVTLSLRYGDSEKRSGYTGTCTRRVTNPSPASIQVTGAPDGSMPMPMSGGSVVGEAGAIVSGSLAGQVEMMRAYQEGLMRGNEAALKTIEGAGRVVEHQQKVLMDLAEKLGAVSLAGPELEMKRLEMQLARDTIEAEAKEKESAMLVQFLPLLNNLASK